MTAADAAKARARKNSVHNDLVLQAQALLALAKKCENRPNKENAKFAAQIRAMIDRWER